MDNLIVDQLIISNNNCSVLDSLTQSVRDSINGNNSTAIEEFEGGYNDALLYGSFGVVLLTFLIAAYSLIKSARFRKSVKKVLQSVKETSDPIASLQASVNEKYDHHSKKTETWKISFAFLSYSTTGKAKKTIVNEATGHFNGGKLTAIMGPSGSGKTTLLNLMSGRTRTGIFSGHRMVNDKRYPPAHFDSFMASQGYVEQSDTFIETMTVRESLLFAAYLRLPNDVSLDEKITRVHHVLDVVGLTSAADVVIGGLVSGFAGISGGQKRRLSIATELLRLPSILLLDEPTSGLDATSSLFLIKLLQKLASEFHITVVTTIHQPRAEIFELFDDVILMDRGGYISYAGPANTVLSYLTRANIIESTTSVNANPADIVIDALGLDPEKTQLSSNPVVIKTETASLSAVVPKLAQKWLKSTEYQTLLSTVACDDRDLDDSVTPRPKQSWLHVQTWTCFERRASQERRHIKQSLLSYAQTTIVALVIASTFSYDPLSSTSSSTTSYSELSDDDKEVLGLYGRMYQTVMLLFTISSYAMVIQYLSMVPTYMVERPLLKLERKCDVISYHSYIYAAFMMELPKAAVNTAILLGVTLAVHDFDDLSYRAIFTMYIILVLGTCAWQSIICVACVASDNTGPVYTSLFLLLGSGLLFSGVCVSYSDIWSVWHWCYYASAPAITARSLIMASAQTTLQDELLIESELKLMSSEAMIIVLVLTCVLGRLAAIGLLYFRDYRAKKLVYDEKLWVTERLRQAAAAAGRGSRQ